MLYLVALMIVSSFLISLYLVSWLQDRRLDKSFQRSRRGFLPAYSRMTFSGTGLLVNVDVERLRRDFPKYDMSMLTTIVLESHQHEYYLSNRQIEELYHLRTNGMRDLYCVLVDKDTRMCVISLNARAMKLRWQQIDSLFESK